MRFMQSTNDKNNEIERLSRDMQEALRQAEDEKEDAVFELKRAKDQELEMVNSSTLCFEYFRYNGYKTYLFSSRFAELQNK